MNIKPMLIKSERCGLYESYNAQAANESYAFYVSRDANEGTTRISVSMRHPECRMAVYLNDDDLDTLATMLRDAHSSQEREQ